MSVSSFAASADTFANGQSFYGRPAGEMPNARVVDLASTRSVNVAYGETVIFRSEGRQFAWTFDGLDRRAVDLSKIAPAGFGDKPLIAYVARDPLNRR
jgi:hypothetical protein